MKEKLFRHYKGGLHEFICMARHSETEEEMVVYRPLYNDSGVWVRPAGMFFDLLKYQASGCRGLKKLKMNDRGGRRGGDRNDKRG